MHQQFQPKLLRDIVAESDHLPELPGCINMQQWEGWLAREEGLHGKMQQDAAILADGKEQYRSAEGRRTFAQNANGFRF